MDFFVEEHAGDHLEVRGVVGDKEFVFAFSLVIQELIFHKEGPGGLGNDFGCVVNLYLEVQVAADLVPDNGVMGTSQDQGIDAVQFPA